MKEVEEYYILGNKISIKTDYTQVRYEVEEAKLNSEEDRILREISREEEVYNRNLDPFSADKVLYYIKKQKFGKLTLPFLDDKVREISYFGNFKPLYVYLEGYGWAVSNIKYDSRDEILSDFKKIFGDKVIRRKNQLIFFDDKMSIIFNASSNENLAFHITKNKSEIRSITQLISDKVLKVSQAALLWEAIQRKSFILLVGNDKVYANIISSILNLLPDYRIINVSKFRNLNLSTEKYLEIPFNSITLNDISLYNPDIVILDDIKKKYINDLIRLHFHNSGIICLTNFPDQYTLLKYLGKDRILTLSKLLAIIVEIFPNSTNIYILKYEQKKIKIQKIKNIDFSANNHVGSKLSKYLNIQAIQNKTIFLNTLLKDNVLDSAVIYDRLKQKEGLLKNVLHS